MKSLPSPHSIACVLTIAAVSSAGAGCASKRPPAFTGSTTSLSPRAKSIEAEGVRVTSEVFTDRERCDRYFHLPNAYANGLAIVYVKVENLHASESLLAQLSGIHLLQGGNLTATGNTAQSTAGAEATAILGAAVISMPLLFIGGAMISRAAMIQENFVTKEFRNDGRTPGAPCLSSGVRPLHLGARIPMPRQSKALSIHFPELSLGLSGSKPQVKTSHANGISRWSMAREWTNEIQSAQPEQFGQQPLRSPFDLHPDFRETYRSLPPWRSCLGLIVRKAHREELI